MAKSKFDDWLTPEGLTRIEGWARDGLTDEQIADNIGIKRWTLWDWQKKFPNLANAIKRGKAPVDLAVENALYKSATGFSKTLRKPMKVRRRGGNEEVVYVEEEVYFPPQVTAQIFWLKNRRRDRWKDKPENIAQDSKTNELLQSIYDLKREDK